MNEFYTDGSDQWLHHGDLCLPGYGAETPVDAARIIKWAETGLGEWSKFADFISCTDPHLLDDYAPGLLSHYARLHYRNALKALPRDESGRPKFLADYIKDLLALEAESGCVVATWMMCITG